MKNTILFLCIFLTSTFAFSQSQSQTQPKEKVSKTKNADDAKEKPKQNTDEFTTLIADYYAAWNTLNPANPSKYYSQEPNLVFYDVTPLQYTGWKEYQNGVVKLLEGFASFKLIPNKDLVVTRKGKIAWTTMTVHISGKQKDGTAIEQDCRHTVIWEKAKGKWLIVHEHVSAPLPAPAGK